MPRPDERPRYLTRRVNGITFLFAYDRDDPELLHIFARHGVTEIDALRVFFDAERQDQWNERHRRYESRNATRLLVWRWWSETERVVLVITCMPQEPYRWESTR